ncbi:hypothetical protein [Solidesulfovibrio magneticus]|uniref:Transglutaminase-like domain-containing protein n=1 Tax=Solidesulfovibrio magneticus (strain ATCC 700980 / DSM 13731 / RS-1) TaxID=573370 RepID=C4XRK6_SOLM1|nr:hypothetical protein [Solidesulfovibrio magneticus]BAH75551.1 hypothetical protein DMR_20600 [Solidesulfovibrio magneticus RS-1]
MPNRAYLCRKPPVAFPAIGQLVLRCLLLALVLVLGLGQTAWTAQPAPAASAARQPRQSAWEFDQVGLKGVLYPSLMLCMAKMQVNPQQQDGELGDANGLLGISVVSPRAGAKAVVELTSSSPLVHPGRVEVALPQKGKVYQVFPYVSMDEAVVLQRHASPATLTAKLWLDGVPQGERSAQVSIASINDCVFGLKDDETYYGTLWLFAAYVNENHPAVQQILQEALTSREVAAFNGYQSDPAGVRKQVKAVWQVLRRRGIRYSNIEKASVKLDDVAVQHVRFVSDALLSRQANCVEGSCLLASIFTKIGLETWLVALPEHMLVAVALDPQGKQMLYLETTLLSESTFEDAAKAGQLQMDEVYAKARKAEARKKAGKAGDEEDAQEPYLISISEVRKRGILPIPDTEEARKRFFLTK